MSLGSTDPLDYVHLGKLKRLIARTEPALVSEHLCWSGVGGRHLNDLLPLPYTEEALAHVCARVAEVQDVLGRELLVENVSSYLAFADATIPEWEFVAAVARRTGCKLLLDVNNIYVNAVNHGFDADAYLAAMPRATRRRDPSRRLRRERPLPDRHPRRAGRAGRLGALRPRDRPLRPAADADRMGHRHSAARHAAARSGDRAGDAWRRAMPSLRELQQGFAGALFAADGAAPPFAIAGPARRRRAHRDLSHARCSPTTAMRSRATYPVVQRLVGAPFFNAAVDDFVRAHRVDERRSQRLWRRVRRFSCRLSARRGTCRICPTSRGSNGRSTRRIAPRMPRARRRPCSRRWRRWRPSGCRRCGLRLDPSCRLVASAFPILRIWQVNQPDYEGDDRVDLDAGGDALLVRRDGDWRVAVAARARASTRGSRRSRRAPRWAPRSTPRRRPMRRSTSARRCASTSPAGRLRSPG